MVIVNDARNQVNPQPCAQCGRSVPIGGHVVVDGVLLHSDCFVRSVDAFIARSGAQ